MTLESAIARFLQYLAAERNLAPRTVEAYGYDLRRFREYIQRDGPPPCLEEIDPFDLKDYLAELRDTRDCRPNTLSRVISSFRVFFRFAVESEFIEKNPALSLHNPRKGRKLPVYLTPDEAVSVCQREDHDATDPLRDRTILILLIMSGIRLAELVGLDCDDLNFDLNAMKVLGKGRKERLVPMNRPLRKALLAWLEVRPRGKGGCPALFLSRDGDRISRRTVQYLVKKTAKALGLDPRLSPHKLRHTFATTLLAETVDLRDIQELLGHASIASTSVYTHTNVEKVRSAVKKLKMQ